MKKSNKLSFRKKGVILLILFAISNSNFAFDLIPASDTGLNYYSGHNDSFKSNNNKDSIPFAPPVNYLAGDHPESIFCADLDLDGDMDMAVANNFDGYVSILKNNGNGIFDDPVNYPAGDDPFSIYCADLDGDDDLDIAVASYYTIAVLFNNGDGTFEGPDIYGEGANHFYFICCADLNGDSYPELVAADPHGFTAVFILINNGDGTFIFDYNNYWVGGSMPWSVSCSDMDGDGDLDMAVANFDSNDVSIFMNIGDGTFIDAVSYLTGANPRYIYTADLDNDLDIDIAVANSESDYVSILINNGDGTFGSAVNYGTGDRPVSIFCSDLDGDNDIDLTLANFSSNNISILTNNGDGTYDSAVNYPTGNGTHSVFGGDLDADGDIDLTVANWGGDNVSVLENLLLVSSILPAEPFSHLLNNYPNPFSHSTEITYQLPASGKVVLKVYDMHAHEIRTLVNENQPAGNHSVVWDGNDNSGNKVGAGVYLYQLKIENHSTVKKLLIIK